MHGHRLTGAPSVGHMPPILPQSAENPLAWTALVRRRAGGRTQLTNEERNGDFTQTYYGKATLQPDGSITGAQNLDVITDPLTGKAFPNNTIPANRISPLGQSMLNLLPQPNYIYNNQTGQFYTSNSAFDQTPLHEASTVEVASALLAAVTTS